MATAYNLLNSNTSYTTAAATAQRVIASHVGLTYRVSPTHRYVWQAVLTLNPHLQISAKDCRYLYLNYRYI